MAKRASLTQPPAAPPTPLSDFISKYRRSTGYVYRSGLLDFLDYVAGQRMRGREATPEDMQKYEAFAAAYLSNKKRDHVLDVVGYARNQSERGVVPKTAHVRLMAVKEFLLRYRIELDKVSVKDVRRLQPKGGRRTDFEYIDKKILSEILHHLDARGKAFVLVLASSGIRIGEALALSWFDLKCPDRKEYPDKPASIFVRDSKTGFSRTTFITRETEAALKEWHKIYDDYRDFATKRSMNLKSVRKIKRNGDNKVFPFTLTSAYAIWDTALKEAGYYNVDEQTKRVKMNIHRLRNFFSVQVASATNTQVSEVLLGHTDKYGGAYTGRPIGQLEEEYKKAEPALTIGTTAQLLEKHTIELQSIKRENEDLRTKLIELEQKQAAQAATANDVKHLEELFRKHFPDKDIKI